ncbi:hypothetical protein A2866_03960 [Candidatus Roizmanbacteria bacterium RIFCSPHIGHO2_01_FULL_39_8]|uniref:NAD-dependent epimerase/dehydratase domain-containing protein n=2 Tax=Candidatus Roizmaniibacteriota TaxID=1752723 RepID=A0A1F7GPS8_9BACT|nr:MAG: hypothetical protein A2866_03960 [Candidatus Roizmanbacteria bacterium RIFCSPHIGHO2_01_FULL_39_8]OGK28118.1 MAG: hypothetical protein A3C28_01170 [Candidatus Roizmanbacteria bacterium RIFCSPHIGHO2_02_FULL_39_9]
MKKLSILLTGSSGYIGRNILEQRKTKYHIVAPSHSELDLTNTEKVDMYFDEYGPFHAVIHCAVIGGKRDAVNLQNILPTNLRMFFNLARNKRHFSKMIHIGTGGEYDKSEPIVKARESDFGKRIPKDEYSFCKYICSQYIEKSENIYSLRLFGIFGKYEDYRIRFISNIICKYIFKLPLTILQNAYFDYVYLNDFIKILDFFIKKRPKYKIYNTSSGQKFELLSLIEKINTLSNYSMPIKLQKKGLNKEYTGDNRRLKKELKNFRFTPIDDSIRELYHWYRKNIHRIDKREILEDSFNK